MNRAATLCILGILALACPPLQAHDLWLAPSTFTPMPGQRVGVQLQVGEALVGEPLPLIPPLVKRFIVRDAAGTRSVAARAGAEPAGQLLVGAPGLQVLGYHSHASRVELEAHKFNTYLREEGLEAVLTLRQQRGQADAPVREHYARCAKGLLQVGPASAAQTDVDLGCALELVVGRNPYAHRQERAQEHAQEHAQDHTQALPIRLTYLGQPLPGALVVAMNSRDPANKLSARSDDQGRVQFTLPAGGMWLVKAVHMVAAAAGVDADWQSYWASVTFER